MRFGLFFLLILLSSFIHFSVFSYHTLYAHGIVDGISQIERFKEAFALGFAQSICFPDIEMAEGFNINHCIESITKYFGKHVNREKMYMGQGADLISIHKTVSSFSFDVPIILYGCSRGASALINYLAIYNPTNVKALILDAAIADFPELLELPLAKLGISQSWSKSFFSFLFPQYLIDSVAPIKVISFIKNKKLPILLIHSKNDILVPYFHSLKLYFEFKSQGFSNVFISIMPYGRHSFLLQNNLIKNLYLQSVHSFYKGYGIPYNEKYANQDIQQYQISNEEIQKLIFFNNKTVIERYEASKIRNFVVVGICIAMCTYYKMLYKSKTI